MGLGAAGSLGTKRHGRKPHGARASEPELGGRTEMERLGAGAPWRAARPRARLKSWDWAPNEDIRQCRAEELQRAQGGALERESAAGRRWIEERAWKREDKVKRLGENVGQIFLKSSGGKNRTQGRRDRDRKKTAGRLR
jgi:hypothetical protein